jgi:hypothetical protein
MSEYNSNQVLTKLYKELQGIGQKKRELKEQRLALAEDSDWHRTDVCTYVFDAAVNKSNGNHFVFTYGETNRTWSHLAGVDEAVMYGRVDWKELLDFKKRVHNTHPFYTLPEQETIDGLTDEQAEWLVHLSLRKSELIRSWEGELAIRDGFDVHKMVWITKPIPQEYVAERKVTSSRMASLQGVSILLKTEKSPEQIRAEGLEPTGHQRLYYKPEVIPFLVDHVKEVLARPSKES